MKKCFVFIVCCLFTGSLVSAADRYWVGPTDGNWNNPANWSLTSGGVGGAGVPSPAAAVIFSRFSQIRMDMSPSVFSFFVGLGIHVILYTSIPTTITITNSLAIAPDGSLRCSTAASVPFDVIFTKGSTGTINGDWIFEGSVPLTTADNPGASFTALTGSMVTVAYAYLFAPYSGDDVIGGRIICNRNSKSIVSTNATLLFDNYSTFITDSKPIASIPYATWAEGRLHTSGPLEFRFATAATIKIIGTMSQVQHLGGIPDYGDLEVDLPALTSNASLDLPDGSTLKGNLTVFNTNNRILTLLSPVGLRSLVWVHIGTENPYSGYLKIHGTSTNVTLAKASSVEPATTYYLQLTYGFYQTGGNFSLQDYNLVTGRTTLDIGDDLIQTGGTFYTNSTSTRTTAKFLVIMNNPVYRPGRMGGFYSSRIIRMSSGTIDNYNHMVTLRVNHAITSSPTHAPNGVILESPLSVGRLELFNGPLTTSHINMVTVNDRSSAAISGGSINSYVNGPLRRSIKSMDPYVFPTGKGNTTGSYVFEPCEIIPESVTPSVYQAEYFKPGFATVETTLPLQGISPDEYWNVLRIYGADARLRLTLNAAVPGSTVLKGIVVAHFTGANWVTENGTVRTPGTSTSGAVTSRALSNFGLFTFGYGTATAFPAPAMTSGLSSTTLEFNPDPLVSTSTLDNQSVNFLKNHKDAKEIPSVYPNPFVESFFIDFYHDGSNTAKASIDLYDLKGHLVYKQPLINLATGYNHISVNLAGKNLPVAVYNAQLNINGMPVKSVKLLKGK